MASRLILAGLLLLTGLSSCNRSLDQHALWSYINDKGNELVQEVTLDNGFSIKVAYKPYELVALQELKRSHHNHWDSILTNYQPYLYFVAKLSKDNRSLEQYYSNNTPQYHKVTNFLNYEISNHVKLITDDREQALLDFSYLSSLGETNSSDIILVFNRPQEDSNYINVQLSTGPLDLGIQEFEFDYKRIKNTPQLKL